MRDTNICRDPIVIVAKKFTLRVYTRFEKKERGFLKKVIHKLSTNFLELSTIYTLIFNPGLCYDFFIPVRACLSARNEEHGEVYKTSKDRGITRKFNRKEAPNVLQGLF